MFKRAHITLGVALGASSVQLFLRFPTPHVAQNRHFSRANLNIEQDIHTHPTCCPFFVLPEHGVSESSSRKQPFFFYPQGLGRRTSSQSRRVPVKTLGAAMVD
ncbi:hypothetical protein DFJ77DRAFT_117391 [Powellomyces hirtus]|nr:hypothetical protein DFJ77DRAFT_117391 [Powellomyces hirtus]